jgi:hypothetical protein
MKLFLVALISALLFARAVPVQSQQASDQSNIPAEEYAIYAALIGKPKVKTLVIEDQTVKHTLQGRISPSRSDSTRSSSPADRFSF